MWIVDSDFNNPSKTVCTITMGGEQTLLLLQTSLEDNNIYVVCILLLGTAWCHFTYYYCDQSHRNRRPCSFNGFIILSATKILLFPSKRSRLDSVKTVRIWYTNAVRNSTAGVQRLKGRNRLMLCGRSKTLDSGTYYVYTLIRNSEFNYGKIVGANFVKLCTQIDIISLQSVPTVAGRRERATENSNFNKRNKKKNFF